MDTVTDNPTNLNDQQHNERGASSRGSFQSPLGFRSDHADLDNMAGRVNPRYMTPTAASRAQINTPEPRASTPPVALSTGKRKAWMVSAAKRVGIVPGTPRSKKEGRVYKRISPRKTVAGPREKVAYQPPKSPLGASFNLPALTKKEVDAEKSETSHQTLEPSPTTYVKDVHRGTRPEKPNPPDKPLPSLPCATIQRRSPLVRRSLIDASEKPLRRSTSPSPGAKVDVEWPTLSPSRPTTPLTTQETVQDGPSEHDGSSTGNRSASYRDYAERGTQHPDDHQRGDEVVSTDHLRHGNQDAIVPTNKAAPAASLSTINNNPIVQHLPSSQDDVRPRASRLPKRLSAPGPDQKSGISRRPLNGRSPPYDQIPANASRGSLTKYDHLSSTARRPGDRAKPHHASQTIDGVNVSLNAVLSLATVKQSSKEGQPNSRRSSIPRPRHNVQLHQDAESETEILVIKPSRKKMSKARATNDDKSDDVDLDTDGHHEGKEKKKIPQLSHPHKECKELGQLLESGSATAKIHGDVSFPREAEEVVHNAAFKSRDGEDHSSATLNEHQDHRSSAPDSSPIADTHFKTGQRRPVIDKPFDRIKRLSAIAPDHGPILRISDSADRIIMGYASEEDLEGDKAAARKRRSVPELRRSVVIKELRKSTEGLLNDHLPMLRSSTTRSLTRYELDEKRSETRDVGRLSNSQQQPQDVVAEVKASSREDPFSICDSKTGVDAHISARQPAPNSMPDWPLRSPPPTSADLRIVEEGSFEDSTPWISPLQGPHTSMLPGQKPQSSKIDNQESWTGSGEISRSVDKRSQLQTSHRDGRSDANSSSIGKKPRPVVFDVDLSAAQRNAQFPPRTSSRADTPDISVRSCAQLNRPSDRDIPNRFESAHPRRLSEDFSLPRSIMFNQETLWKSVHELQDGEMSKISTPPSMETSRPQLSSAKGMFSNIKGLFHKRGVDIPSGSNAMKTRVSSPPARHGMVTVNGSPFLNYHPRTLPANYGATKKARSGASVVPTPKDAFPRPTSPKEPQAPTLEADDFYQATDLAVRLLDAARTEQEPSKRTKLLQLGQLMVEAVTGARDAEKAMEEAKQATARAEMHCMKTKKSVLELTRLVGKELNDD